MEEVYHANSSQKGTRMAIQISDRMDIKEKTVLETKKDIL